jgi:diamine N-acetyltransferase
VISLQPIDASNRVAVEALRVGPGQERFVSGVADSLLEAAEYPDACPVSWAIHAEEVPVGFVMISDGIPPGRPEYIGPYFLWKLLIDERHQGRGLGRDTLDAIVAHVRGRPDAEALLTSAVPGEGSPIGFYERYGFERTGEIFHGEVVLRLSLR